MANQKERSPRSNYQSQFSTTHVNTNQKLGDRLPTHKPLSFQTGSTENRIMRRNLLVPTEVI